MDGLTRLLVEQQSAFLTQHQVDLTMVTWNVNGIQPPSVDVISEALLPERTSAMIAVGLQELSAADAYYGGQEAESRHNFELWKASLLFAINFKYAGVGVDGEYAVVGEARMAAIGLLVFARTTMDIVMVSKNVVPCGVMGVMANKGAVACKLRIDETVIVIVCAHLAAHLEYWGRRNQDYLDICTRMSLPGSVPRDDTRDAQSAVKRWLRATGDSMEDCHHFFWMGDLNYRLNDTDRDRVLKMATASDYDALMRTDQLALSMFMKTAFVEYFEPQICFPPTFKYQHGSVMFDKQRTPAYCDRILWRDSGELVQSIVYDSPPLFLSDHKPVVAVVLFTAQRVDPQKFKIAHQRALSQLDEMENERIPVTELRVVGAQVEGVLAVGECWFGGAHGGQAVLRNEGKTVAEYGVRLGVAGDGDVSWIRVSPMTGILLPNAAVTLNITVHVDTKSAAVLNKDPIRFSTIIVVLVVNGRDHFVSVEGKYHVSHFAAESPNDGVPAALQKLGDFMKTHDGAKHPNMLMQPGAPGLLDELIRAIDADSAIDPKFGEGDNMLAVGECLLVYLQSSLEPLKCNQLALQFVVDLFKESLSDGVDGDAVRVVLAGALCKEPVIDEGKGKELLQFMRQYI